MGASYRVEPVKWGRPWVLGRHYGEHRNIPSEGLSCVFSEIDKDLQISFQEIDSDRPFK